MHFNNFICLLDFFIIHTHNNISILRVPSMFKSHQWSLRALPFYSAFFKCNICLSHLEVFFFFIYGLWRWKIILSKKIIACFKSFTFIILMYIFLILILYPERVSYSHPYPNNIIAKYLVSFSLVSHMEPGRCLLFFLLDSYIPSENDWRLGWMQGGGWGWRRGADQTVGAQPCVPPTTFYGPRIP